MKAEIKYQQTTTTTKNYDETENNKIVIWTEWILIVSSIAFIFILKRDFWSSSENREREIKFDIESTYIF